VPVIDPAGACTSVGELLQTRARHQPDRLGYRYLVDGETEEQTLTYAEADARTRAVAAAVRAAGGGPGSRVLLVLPPGLDYVVAVLGCLYARTVAVPVYPPDPFRLDRSLGRVVAVARDAEPVVALTIAPLLGYVEELGKQAPELAALRWVAVDIAPEPDDHAVSDVAEVAADDLAVLQYTSGSTAQPRGVMLSHRNLLHNSDLIRRTFQVTPESHGLIWLPPYHDMGLIGGLVQPLYVGCPVTLMSPLHFLEQPLRWLRAISRYRTTASGGPNFAFDLCARRATDDDVAGLDLTCWEVAFNGAEPIRPAALARFAERFGPAGFDPSAYLPCYGLAEATLIVSGGRNLTVVDVDGAALGADKVRTATDAPATRLVACGTGGADQQIAIVHAATAEPSAADEVGEIWVAGPSVARGYWRNPEQTEQVFGARTATGAGPFLRTGDLGFLLDGQLVITGRRKDLIIVRGRNHYPQEIEETAERADPALRPGCTAAFAVEPDGGGDAELVVVLEIRRKHEDVDVAAIAARVRALVAEEHGLQVRSVVLLHSGGMPKTSSGKVQRWLCRERLCSGELPVLGEGTAVAEPVKVAAVPTSAVHAAAPADRAQILAGWLRSQVAELAELPVGAVDPGLPLVSAGLDSLGMTQLRHRVEAELGVRPEIGLLLGAVPLADVATALDIAMATGSVPQAHDHDGPSPYASGEHVLPLSQAQRWMWVVSRVDPDDTRYHLAVALRFPGAADLAALQRAVDAVVARHPAMRTTFPVREREPVQLVHAQLPVAVRVREAPAAGDEVLVRRLTRSTRRPFDLADGPLVRVELHRDPARDVLLLVVHHMIVDFRSLTVLARELGTFYGSSAQLPPPAMTYPDVVLAEQRLLADPALAEPLARYWDAQIADGVPQLPLAASAPAGARRFTVPSELGRRLRETTAREHVTVYMLLLAVFQTVLHLRTGLAELVVGTNTAGRDHPGYEDVVGCCTNPVPLRSRIDPAEPFRALLQRTRDQVVGALDHQDYPMRLLAERQRVALGGRGLYEALCTFNRSAGVDLAAAAVIGLPGTFALGPLQVENVPLPQGESALPIEVVLAEAAGMLHGTLRYGPGILDDDGADALVAQLLAALDAVAGDTGIEVGALLPVAERSSGPRVPVT
jgi:acyl-CoA synthetase (AMP-forming)/AMP-acid ligase II